MKNTIHDAINSVIVFFGGSYSSYDSIWPVKYFLELWSLEMATFASCIKSDGNYSYLCIASKDESIKVVFVYKHTPGQGTGYIAMFCIKDSEIFEYVNNKQKFISSGEFYNGYSGLAMMATAKSFCCGKIENELINSVDSIITDILSYQKNSVQNA